jgi:uncharacterized membrane protein YccC
MTGPALTPPRGDTSVELLATLAAGTAGAVVAALLVGASLLLILPAVVGVGVVAVVTDRTRHHDER